MSFKITEFEDLSDSPAPAFHAELSELLAGEFEDLSDKRVHECLIRIHEEAVGFSIESLTLPGVVSEGDTLDEALRNIKDAFCEAFASYEQLGEPIPWVKSSDDDTAPENSRDLWILVNA